MCEHFSCGSCGIAVFKILYIVQYLMFYNYNHLLNSCLRKLVLFCTLLVSFQALAQFQGAVPQAVQGAVDTQDSVGTLGTLGTLITPGAQVAQPVGGVQGLAGAKAPLMFQRPEAAAIPDALRMQLPRPPKTQTAGQLQRPSQFQLFVKEATGKLLPNYGIELFDDPQAYTADSAAVAPADYALSAGDEVRIQIWGSVDYNGTHMLDRNGQITLPKVGVVTLAGTQMKDLEATLRKQVATVFNNFSLNVNIGRLRGITVYVVGQAQQPGTYNLSSLSTLVNALFASGGPTANGSMRHIQLKRAGKTVTTFDVYEFISKGDKSKDVSLQAGDVIVIPPVGPRVALLGATDHAAIYEIKTSASVQDILSFGGGLPTLATPQKALLERIDNTQMPPRKVQDLALDAPGLQTPLRDGDVLTLLATSSQFSNAVTLRGNVAAPQRHSYTLGMRVSDLITDPRALIQGTYFKTKNGLVQSAAGDTVSGEKVVNEMKNLLEEINWDYAVIERLNAVEVKTQLIPFNLGKAIKDKDPAHNLTLMPGDVVTIFGVKDLPVPIEKRTQFVRIGGEVKVPGYYQIAPNETMNQVILRAGGLTSNAYKFGTVFTRETTRTEQQANLDKAISKLEQEVGGQTATQVQNIVTADQKDILQSQMAGQQILLARLKNLRASGRIGLEISFEKPEFPEISLEDGDIITVPKTPSFMGVFGAVTAETSFIIKSGQTVGEYIEKAGPNRQADLQSALLIRADGTVQSNKASRSWFGLGHSNFLSLVVHPGDSIFIPELIDRRTAYSSFIQGAKDWTSILYQFGLGVAAIKILRN